MLRSIRLFYKTIIRLINKIIFRIILILKFILKHIKEFSLFLRTKLTKDNILSVVKSLCFIMIIYHASLMTKQYLNYEYDYKYNVTHNVGYYLPPISVCMENSVFYDKRFLNEYFDISHQFDLFNRSYHDQQLHLFDNCVEKWTNFYKTEKNFWIKPVIVKYSLSNLKGESLVSLKAIAN